MEIRNKSKPNPGDLKIDDGWEEFRRKQNKEKASKDEINTKTHNEDKKATRALIATILIISFFLILL